MEKKNLRVPFVVEIESPCIVRVAVQITAGIYALSHFVPDEKSFMFVDFFFEFVDKTRAYHKYDHYY